MGFLYESSARISKRFINIMVAAVVVLSSMLSMVAIANASPTPAFYDGFEVDTGSWFDSNDSGWEGYGYIEQASSGSAGITSSEGAGHAVADGYGGGSPYGALYDDMGPFSRFDGYRDTWTGTWIAEIDVYLDPSWAAGEGFDYSVAASGSDGSHQRDYIFHVTKDSSTGDLLVAGSNNTNFATRENLETINHYVVPSAGWYTFQHVFYNDGGALAVDLNLINASGTVVFTETRYNAVDTIPAEVGGSRYAWFTVIDVAGGIAVDAFSLTTLPMGVIHTPVDSEVTSGTASLTASYYDGDMANDDAVQWAVRFETCTQNTNTVAGNVDGYNSSFTWNGMDFSADLDTTSLSDGMYCFVFNPTDDASETNVRETRWFYVDNTAPDKVSGLTIWQNGTDLGCDVRLRERLITVDWDDSTDPNFDYYQYQADDGVGSIDFTTTVSVSERTGMIRDIDGTYQYRVRAIDAVGNVGQWSDWCTVTLDREAPVVSIDEPLDDAVLSGLVDIAGVVSDNIELSHYNLSLYPSTTDLSDGQTHSGERLNDANWCTSPISGTVNTSVNVNGDLCTAWDTTNYPDGEYQLRLAARDATGNRDTTDPYTGGTTSVHVIDITIANEVEETEEGEVLGVVDENNDNGNVLGATTDDGNVLGTNDVLAETGEPTWLLLTVGLFVISLATATLKLTTSKQRN